MSSYSIVEIPGWEQISLDPADDAATERRIAELAHGTVPESVPRDTATPFREEVRKHLERVALSARSSGAGILCIPVEQVAGQPVPATYTVGEWSDSLVAGIASEELLEAMVETADGEASIAVIDGQPALREETVIAPDPTADPLAAHPARRVTYTIAAPEQDGRWIVFTFATLGNGDPDGPLAHALVELFDAHVQTLNWNAA